MRRLDFSARTRVRTRVGPLTVQPSFVNGELASVLISLDGADLIAVVAPGMLGSYGEVEPELVVYVDDAEMRRVKAGTPELSS